MMPSVDQCYIGACTGAKLEDLHMAAAILGGRKVASGTRLLLAPASTRITAAAAADGTLAKLTEAGAILMPSGCGACAGYGAGILAEGETCMLPRRRETSKAGWARRHLKSISARPILLPQQPYVAALPIRAPFWRRTDNARHGLEIW